MAEITKEEEYFELVIDKDGNVERQRRVRYLVASPEKNHTRNALAEMLKRRRDSAKEGLTRPHLASAVSAADEFDTISSPTLAHRQHYAMQLRGAKLNQAEADELSGLDDHYARIEAAWAKSKAA